ncbi:unnamed protein product [Phytomonas sp. Hart1]|nr:unnamed protein product [Phytomonas sp. Hart1]|eukprot:CCW70480.1 unnamed protein product [Phytomonas sp. isolate Hart1]
MPRGTEKPGVSFYQNLNDSKSLFFSLERAFFYDPMTVSETVTVEFPATQNMKDGLHEEVLRRFVHKPYSVLSNRVPICEERSEDNFVMGFSCSASSPTVSLLLTSSADLTTSRVREGVTGESPYFIVHLHGIRVLAETVQQANDRGDLRIDVALTLRLARVHHGMLFGVAEASDFDNYFSVCVPLNQNVTNITKASLRCADKKVRRLESSDELETDGHGEGKRQRSSHIQADPDPDLSNSKVATREGEKELCEREMPFRKVTSSIEVLVRRQTEEPVVAGQVVLVVVEPGCIRCTAIRPPRAAPGPFRLVASKLSDEAPDRLSKSKRKVKRSATLKKVDNLVDPMCIDVVCDIPLEVTK